MHLGESSMIRENQWNVHRFTISIVFHFRSYMSCYIQKLVLSSELFDAFNQGVHTRVFIISYKLAVTIHIYTYIC